MLPGLLRFTFLCRLLATALRCALLRPLLQMAENVFLENPAVAPRGLNLFRVNALLFRELFSRRGSVSVLLHYSRLPAH